MSGSHKHEVALFPGHGAHAPAMIARFQDASRFRRLIPLVNDLANADALAQIAADSGALNRNAIASTLITLCNLSAYDEALAAGHTFKAALGYSVGLWSALHVAGVCDEETLVRLVWRRATLMDADEGGRAGAMLGVLGVGLEAAESVCDELRAAGRPVFVSNINAPGNLSLAMRAADAGEAEAALTALQPRSISRLPVSGAWHCLLLGEAATAFSAALEQAPLSAPAMPVGCNVTGGWLPHDITTLKGRLAEHISAPVRWMQGVRAAVETGAESGLELGYGDMLSRFQPFISRDMTVRPWASAQRQRNRAAA